MELNPSFAPAYAQLAHEYLRRNQNLEEALNLAHKAVLLEPGTVNYWITGGHILLRLDRLAEAKVVGERVQAISTTLDERRQSADYLEAVQHYEDWAQKSMPFYYDDKGADLLPWLREAIAEVQAERS